MSLALAAGGLLWLSASLANGQEFIRGDVDADGRVDGIVDANHALALLYAPGQPPASCMWTTDSNGDTAFNISDVIFLINYQFIDGSPEPPAPGPTTCGPQPLTTFLPCSSYPCAIAPIQPDPEHVLAIEDFIGNVGQVRDLTVTYDYLASTTTRVNGISFGVMHDPSVVTLHFVALDSAYLALDIGQPDFFQVNTYPNGFTFGAINDFLYSDAFEPGSYDLLSVRYELISPGSSEIAFTETLGSPTVALSIATLPAVTRIMPTTIDGVVESQEAIFQRGDANDDGVIDVGDAIRILSQGFVPGAPAPICADANDTNDDGANDIADAIFLLSYLFFAGAPLPDPGATCGVDSTLDILGCENSFCF